MDPNAPDPDDPDTDLDTIDWGELYRMSWDALIDWGSHLLATADKDVDWATDTLFPVPPPKLEDLLASFDLEDEANARKAAIQWNDSDARQAVHDAAGQEKEDVDAARAAADPPQGLGDAAVAAGLGAASAALGAVAAMTDTLDVNVPKDAVHVSDAAAPFKNWHIQTIPDSYVAPYEELIPDTSIIENIKKARGMLLAVPHGDQGTVKKQPAGTMAWTRYEPKKTEGWMYVEPSGSEYAQWFWQQMQDHYARGKTKADAADADPSLTANDKAAARTEMRAVSAATAVMQQEGLPSAVNTYDGTILTWCSGLAAQGAVPDIFYAISKDPNVHKAMYLCGFLYQGLPGAPAYQVVDIQSKIPRILYRGDFATNDVLEPTNPTKVRYPKGTQDYLAYKVLQTFVAQIELVYLLIMIARDPLTRETVFNANFNKVCGMVIVGGSETIATEALYVFIGEVQHNWFLRRKNGQTMNVVDWAVAHFDSTEAALSAPSEERDRAIAKGVFRYTLRTIQRAAWARAVEQLKQAAKKEGTKTPNAKVDFSDFMRRVVYGFNRLVDNYWTPMQTGTSPQGRSPHTMGGSTLPVPGFPSALDGAPIVPDDVIANDGSGNQWNIGKQAQCDFLIYPTAEIRLSGFDDNGDILIQRQSGAGAVWVDVGTLPKPEKGD
jgi:hypothetical protein